MQIYKKNNSEKPVVLRLNSVTFPMNKKETDIFASSNAEMVAIEGNTDDEISEFSEFADAVIVVSSYLRTSVIRNMKKCRIISRMGTGYDKIDVEQATKQGIIVTNIPDFCTDEVADHTLALLLASARQIKDYDLTMRKGNKPIGANGIHRLANQTVGLIGFGRIGQAVAKRCNAFGMTVLFHDPGYTSNSHPSGAAKASTLDDLLNKSDYVCLLCPLLPSTREMISMPQLKKMKKTSILVNTGRGELVNEGDLAIALKEGVIKFAALDVFGCINVFSPDGFLTNHPLFKLNNVLLTPHVAAYSEEAFNYSYSTSAQAVVDVLNGECPQHIVNPQTPQNLLTEDNKIIAKINKIV